VAGRSGVSRETSVGPLVSAITVCTPTLTYPGHGIVLPKFILLYLELITVSLLCLLRKLNAARKKLKKLQELVKKTEEVLCSVPMHLSLEILQCFTVPL
jgi:hypothetical protein